MTVRLTLRKPAGEIVNGGAAEVTLPAQGHVAQFLAQFFPRLDLTEFRGTITGETSAQIGATVIRQSVAPQELATMPVTDIVP